MWRSGSASLKEWRYRIFTVTWIAYAGLYLCRKNFSVVMPILDKHSGMGSLSLANVIFVYSLMYAVGQPLFGFLADRYGARLIVCGGMCVAAGANIAMAFNSSSTALFVLMIVNGIGQAAGWPGLVQMMANWYPRERRGIVMSWWTTNYVLGSFLATLFAAYIVTATLPLAGTGLQRAFWVPAALLLGIALLYYVAARNTPADAGFDAGADAAREDPTAGQRRASVPEAEKPAFFKVVRSPAVLIISCGCLFAKITRYAFLFWLPLYMTEQLGYRVSEAGYTSAVFELAGFVGALAAGYLSDKLFQSRRFPVSASMFWLLAVMCLLQPFLASRGHFLNAFGIAMIGIANFGPDTLLQGAASQDAGSGIGTGVVSGFISGVGSIGQLISPYLVAFVTGRYGWNVLFHLFVVVAFAGGVLQALLWNYGKNTKEQLEAMPG